MPGGPGWPGEPGWPGGPGEPCAEILCIRTEDEKRMIIKCHACAENQGEPDVAIMGVVQKRYACAEIPCIRKIPPVALVVGPRVLVRVREGGGVY